ncbi:MAG: hypothetical protein RR413_05735 [Christensenellaceae bacterium]
MAMVMMVAFCVPAMAMEPLKSTTGDGLYKGKIVVSEKELDGDQTRGWNPVFYSGKVYGYNSSTNYIALAGESTWSWGAVQPDYISVAKEDYWWLAANDYDYWRFEYTWNSKDCTYVKIYNAQGEVYIESAVQPNTNYDISFFQQGMTSEINLRMDWIVDGFRVNGNTIGGMKVIYN